MTNKKIVKAFLRYYQDHDYKGMHGLLDDHVKFIDYLYKIEGESVKAMWHWYCVPYEYRIWPIDVPNFKVKEATGDTVEATYRVCYLLGRNRRPLDYYIDSQFTVSNGKIVEQRDHFGNISESEFLLMACGLPLRWQMLAPLFRHGLRIIARMKLRKFMLRKEKA